jgi:hypothetical protein
MLDKHRTGVAVGLFLGGWHLVWALLVASGWGQPLIDFVLWLHMIHLPYVVGPFQLLPAALLVVLTGLSGYLLGWLFAVAWNSAHRVP